MPSPKDFTGQRFGTVVVMHREGWTAKRQSLWRVRNDAGEEFILRIDHLREMHRPRIYRQHRLSYAPLYAIWNGMMQRCNNPANPDYDNYGGRGIRVCAHWQSIANFIADVSPRPSTEYSIDRVNNDGGYEPGNWRWATARQQAHNKRGRA